MAELKHRADRRRLVEDAALTKAMVEERAAIARDLHDVISHHVSATGVQAGAARRALERGFTEAVKTSIQSIEHANRVASAELHRQLDLLHGAAIDGQRKPSIANLDQVIEIVRRSGVEVDARVVHLPVNLEQSVDITVYRICQELLTNALKHGSGRVYLSIVATETRICIEQTNILSQSSDQFVPGRGLTGIFQRVCLFGGVFHYGHNRATSTWWAKASIPIGDV
ncbi:sensor histidine kinase [Mycobacteroides abscessus]|uniref:sensor histidine kinase n=1 Tax=Mycobacteroides abscessus TaxID=36809 RepID=UPI0009408222|nr:histidine kinase [Mycobacteroides abscessus]